MASPAPSMGPVGSITDTPKAGQMIQHSGETYTTIQEGQAYILVPPSTPASLDPKAAKDGTLPAAQNVFYNPIQQYNRDLTVLAIRAFGEEYVREARASLQVNQARALKKKERRDARIRRTLAAEEQIDRPTKRARVDGPPEKAPVQPDENSWSVPERDDEQQGQNRHEAANEAMDIDDIADEDLIACEKSITQPPKSMSLSQEQDGRVAPQALRTETEPRVNFDILDALSASGLRALRYAKELPFVTSVTANDLSRKAVQSIKLNIEHNNLGGKVQATVSNANAHMYQFVGQEAAGGPSKSYAVIDLDPYGTAVPFLDAAVQAISDGGLLCVTCTDTGVFNAASYPEKCFALYGGLAIKGLYCHEGGLRLILHAITTAAAKYGRSVEPLLSLSIDYYARIFVRIRKSPKEVKLLAGKTMVVYECGQGCGSWQTQFIVRHAKEIAKNGDFFYKFKAAQGPTASPHCEHCGNKTHIAGPMYGGPLHNPEFIKRILDILPNVDDNIYSTKQRLEGMLNTALDETELYEGSDNVSSKASLNDGNERLFGQVDPCMVDRHPFYVVPSALARVLHCQAPSVPQLRGALRYRGYRVTASHAKPSSIKTDAPWSDIWKIMLEWIRQHAPIVEGRVKEGTPGWKILKGLPITPPTIDLNEVGIAADKENSTEKTEKDSAKQSEPGNGKVASEATGEVSNDTAIKKPWVVFDEKLGKDQARGKLKRYQVNPRANWGPMARAKSSFNSERRQNGELSTS